MACSNCGYSGAYSRHSCPNCNPAGRASYSAEQAQSDRIAGYQLGHGFVSGIVWLLSNRYLSYVWFWLVWAIATFTIGENLGWVSDDWMERPFGLDVFGAILPIAIAIIFRKQIPGIMRWVWLGLIAALAGLVVLKLVGDKEPAAQANPVTQTAPLSADKPPAVRAEAVRKALHEAATSEITFIAPGSDETPNVIFEGISMRLCEIDDPSMAVCQRYCATLEVNDRPRWCN